MEPIIILTYALYSFSGYFVGTNLYNYYIYKRDYNIIKKKFDTIELNFELIHLSLNRIDSKLD